MTGLGWLQKECHIKVVNISKVVAADMRRKVRKGNERRGGDKLQKHT